VINRFFFLVPAALSSTTTLLQLAQNLKFKFLNRAFVNLIVNKTIANTTCVSSFELMGNK